VGPGAGVTYPWGMDGSRRPFTNKSPTVLIIEDDEIFRSTLVTTLHAMGYPVQSCTTAQEGLALARKFQPSVVVSDVHLANGDGRMVLRKLREQDATHDIQFVLMTGDWVGASKQSSVELEADDYLAKPFSIPEFIACVEERLRVASL